MKFLFFTPAASSSAIGRVTQLVGRELMASAHTVTIVRTEDYALLGTPPHQFGTKMVRWDDTEGVFRVARDADAIVYQIGDSFPFHRGCLEWLPSLPGIVCLHDYFLGDLFRGWAGARWTVAQAILQSCYGEEVAASYFAYDNPADYIAGTREKAPMTEWVAAMATGVITHSSWDIQRVLHSCPGPVEVIPLAYDKPKAGPATGSGSAPVPVDNSATRDAMLVLTIGRINANKRVDSVLRAIGTSPQLQNTAILRLVGHIESDVQARLSALAHSLGVRLLISGEVDEATLAHAIDRADVVCCLRFPPLEAASASTIEAMLCGKAVIVTDTGFYRELPDDCVCKVRPDHEVGDLQEKLVFLCHHPAERSALGNRAAQWATATFSPRLYADRLVDFALRAARIQPVIEAGRFFANLLVGWGATGDGLPMQDTVAPLRIFEQSCR
jgi:glycosyltransferase involved in cell wall biosynthesis